VYLADPATGDAARMLTETEKTWVDIKTDCLFLAKSRQFLWTSERDGYAHVYLYGMDGRLVRQLTEGKWDVERIAGVDEERRIVYFTASVTSPLERDLYSVNLDGKGFRRISKEHGTHAITFAPDHELYMDVFSDANTPPRTNFHKSDGTLIRTAEEGKLEALGEYTISPQTFFTFTTTDGVELNGWMIKPPGFSPSTKYPVLMYVYGGPGSQTVRNSWGGQNFVWYQLLAQKGYIIVSVDNRGTGARGKEFKSVTYKNLGHWEAKDQAEAARYLASLPYVDGSRIGIWGWSYGGYMTLMSLLEGGDVFKAGVSVAPVTSWKFYDSIYTERYMLTPEENPKGYEESAPIAKAADLKSKLLIIHGTADDNVHWQNTVTMVNELTKAGKQFQTAFYPGGLHGIGTGAVRAQLFTRITNYIITNL
jgi:dipeptidyl-peptidase-4